jgi:uncharacterized protein YjbI with pentapeptide repeats
MANAEHLIMIKRGVREWNEWIKRDPFLKPDLSYVNLTNENLHRINLRQVNLSNTSLSGANLSSANLKMATLAGANLNKTNLNHANLTRANLRNVGLFHASLMGTNLSRADFSMAGIGWVTFVNTDLSTVKGLDTIHHFGPSNIDIDTLYKSGGRIPKEFLSGCGVPDEFISYLPSLIGAKQAIQFYSCFISYSHKDEEFARRLYSRLRDTHIRVWFAPEDIKGGEKLYEQIDTAIKYHDKLLLVLSDNSIRSEWVITEIRKARREELKEKRRKLFPIRLVDFDTLRKWECFDADSGKDLAVEVREYFIPDFSNWKDYDAFESAFERLLHDLRAEELTHAGT